MSDQTTSDQAIELQNIGTLSAPVASRVVISTSEGLTGFGAWLTNSGRGVTFSLAEGGGPQHGVLTFNRFGAQGLYSYELNPGFVGSDSFTYARTKDGVTTTASVDITAVLEAPVSFVGGSGADVLFGGSLANTINGGKGRDYLHGGGGNDVLTGGPGGGNDRDEIEGGDGNDTLYAGGNDYFYGGAGDDLLIVVSQPNFSTPYNLDFTGGAGVDTLKTPFGGGMSRDIEILRITSAGDVWGAGNDLQNFLYGGAGANELSGGGGADSL